MSSSSERESSSEEEGPIDSNAFHLTFQNQKDDLQRLLRLFYASSPMLESENLKCLTGVSDVVVEQLFHAPLRRKFHGKLTIVRPFLERLASYLTRHNRYSARLYDDIRKLDDDAEPNYYRYYIGNLPSRDIILQEQTEMEEATGLVTWSAAHFLSNYLIFNKTDVRASDTVLELGAGCGLAGICAAKYSNCKKLIGTDVNSDVLDQLIENYRLNFGADSATGGEDDTTECEVVPLDWRKALDYEEVLESADVVIATDVVCDDFPLDDLVFALEISAAKARTVLVAVERRNSDTLWLFRQAITESKEIFIFKESAAKIDDETPDIIIEWKCIGTECADEDEVAMMIAPDRPFRDRLFIFELRHVSYLDSCPE